MSMEPPGDPTGLTRREFLMTSGGAVVVGTTTMAQVDDGNQSSVSDKDADDSSIEGNVPVTLRINGRSHALKIDPRMTLLDCLRETVALTGTK